MRRKGVVFCIIFFTLLIFSAVSPGGERKEEMALKAANEWLVLVDEGRYAESWESASEYFKNALPSSAWQQSLAAVRTPLGKMVSRVSKSTEFKTSLPGAPDGEYVVIIYETSFAHKQSATEIVTPMQEKDGTWKVSGYYIK